MGYRSSLYMGHSFHIGAPTTVVQYRLSDTLIKTLGQWQSATYTVYIRTPCGTVLSSTVAVPACRGHMIDLLC